MLHRVGLGAETVLITGASGGVGSAAIQLAKRRGARIIALSSLSKADEVLDRAANLEEKLGHEKVDVVVDLVSKLARYLKTWRALYRIWRDCWANLRDRYSHALSQRFNAYGCNRPRGNCF